MKKNKKQSNIGRVFGVIFSIVMIAATMYLLFNIIKLNVLPTKLLFLITIVFVLFFGILSRWILHVKDWWTTFKYDECC